MMEMMKIWVTGGDGQLGNELRKLENDYPGYAFLFTDLDVDLTDQPSVVNFATENQPVFILNCAAYTAVDKAEVEQEHCRKVNVNAVENIARAASVISAKVIHISTDYVYGGKSHRPYNEYADCDPESIYGKTKLEGEQRLLELHPQSVILRTSWLYSNHGNNFVKTMTRLGKERPMLSVVFDQIGTPTWAADLAKAIMSIVDEGVLGQFHTGIFNYSNEGVCSWYDFAKEIHELAGITDCYLEPIESDQYPTLALRPFYSVMNKKKIKTVYKLEIPHWRESLIDCMYELGEKENL